MSTTDTSSEDASGRTEPVLVAYTPSRLASVQSWLSRHARLVRWVSCGPVTLVLTVLVMMGSAHWLPAGAAGADNIAMPVILFPVIWAGVFIYALAEENLLRGVLVMSGLILAHMGLLAIVM